MQDIKSITADRIQELSTHNKEPNWILEKRLEAWHAFQNTEMPDLKYGLDIRMDLRGLDINKVNPNVIENIQMPDRKDIIIRPLTDAINENPEIVKKHFMRTANLTDKFSSLHWALWNRGLFIYVPKGVQAENLHLNFDAVDGSVLENILIVLEPLSSLTFLETLSGNPVFRSSVTEIFLGEGARLNFGSLQKYGQTTYNFSARKAYTERDAKLDWVTFDMGSFRTLSDITTVMTSPGAESRTIGMYFGNSSQQFNFSVNSIHAAPDTTSDMLVKGALNDHAKVIYRGLVKIEKNACRSNGYQLEDTLLLSDDAEADPVPNLEIDNNDVRCTHGTTVGHVDPDKIFYMMSRGIDEVEAKKRIVEGFFEPVINKLTVKVMENDLRKLLEKKIEEIK